MRILAETSPGEVRIAVVDGTGMLVDFAIWRPGRPDGVGDLHRGRVIARVAARSLPWPMPRAFCRIGKEAAGFRPGQWWPCALRARHKAAKGRGFPRN